MVDHANYAAYTWVELNAAIYGGDDGSSNYAKTFLGGMNEPYYALVKVDAALAKVMLEIEDDLKRLKQFWQGPAADAFDSIINSSVRQYMWDTLDRIRNPYWYMLLADIQSRLVYMQHEGIPWAHDQGWTFIPPEIRKTWIPPEYVPPGPDGSAGYTYDGYYKMDIILPRWEWIEEEAAKAGRPLLQATADLFKLRESEYQNLPPVPPPGKKPSEIQAEKEAKKEKEDAKKQADEDRKKAEDDKKAFDKKAEDDQKAADKRFDDAQKQQAKQFDDAQKAQAKQFEDAQKQSADLANQPPPAPPGGELPVPGAGDVPFGADPGGELPKPGDAPLPGEALLGEPGGPGAPAGVPTFFGGTPVPGGIDLDGDGKPELDEQGNLLPGVDPSKIPPDALGTPPFGLGAAGPGLPPTFPPGTVFRPPPLGPGLDLEDGKPTNGIPNGKPFVRPPNLLDGNGPGKGPNLGGSNGNIPFVRSPAGPGGPGGADEFEPGRPRRPGAAGPTAEPVSGAGGKVLGAGGPVAPGRLVGPGLPGMGPGGMGYPPPMSPMGGMGMGGQQGQERERQTWLLEDDEIWSDDEPATGVLGRAADDDEEDEYAAP